VRDSAGGVQRCGRAAKARGDGNETRAFSEVALPRAAPSLKSKAVLMSFSVTTMSVPAP